MKQIVLITRASSRFGRLIARAPGDAGHTVYAHKAMPDGPSLAQRDANRYHAVVDVTGAVAAS